MSLAQVCALRYLGRVHVEVWLQLGRLELLSHCLSLVDDQGRVWLLVGETGASLGCVYLLLVAPRADPLRHKGSVVLFCSIFIFNRAQAGLHSLAVRPYYLLRADYVASRLIDVLARGAPLGMELMGRCLLGSQYFTSLSRDRVLRRHLRGVRYCRPVLTCCTLRLSLGHGAVEVQGLAGNPTVHGAFTSALTQARLMRLPHEALSSSLGVRALVDVSIRVRLLDTHDP